MAAIYLVGAVRGLVKEGERMATIIERVGPDAVALSLSREGMEAMNAPGNTDTRPANVEEKLYMEGLSEFGEVVKPPPCFSAAMLTASAMGVPVVPLDMDDEHYTAAYCKYVSTMDMMRQGNSHKRYSRHVFLADTPQEFVAEWDGLVNRLKGYRDLENAREDWFARGLSRLSGKYGKVLAVIELERLPGVRERLRAMGHSPELP